MPEELQVSERQTLVQQLHSEPMPPLGGLMNWQIQLKSRTTHQNQYAALSSAPIA